MAHYLHPSQVMSKYKGRQNTEVHNFMSSPWNSAVSLHRIYFKKIPPTFPSKIKIEHKSQSGSHCEELARSFLARDKNTTAENSKDLRLVNCLEKFPSQWAYTTKSRLKKKIKISKTEWPWAITYFLPCSSDLAQCEERRIQSGWKGVTTQESLSPQSPGFLAPGRD